MLSRQRLVERGGLTGAAVVILLGGVRSTRRLALLRLSALCSSILGDVLMPGEDAHRLSSWLHGTSLQCVTFQQLEYRNKQKQN